MSKIHFKFVGELGGWNDFRDFLIVHLKQYDTEEKFNRLLEGLILSLGVSAESMQNLRKDMGMTEFSEEDMKKIKRTLKEKDTNKSQELSSLNSIKRIEKNLKGGNKRND